MVLGLGTALEQNVCLSVCWWSLVALLITLPFPLPPRIWMGVELDHAHGKNDGSRSGTRYFKCRPNHGVFVLPSKVKRSVSDDFIEGVMEGGMGEKERERERVSVRQPH